MELSNTGFYFTGGENECREELRNLRDTYGCCSTNISIASDAVLQSELWETCGVDFPVECGKIYVNS